MADLGRRSDALERMDADDAPFPAFEQCLRHLAAINRASGAYRPTLAWLDRLPRRDAPLHVLDVGSGHGDMLRRVAAWGRRRGVALRLTGLDANPWSARAAAEATAEADGIVYRTGDAFAWDEPVDAVISSLFAHHLNDAALTRFLRRMGEVARVGWFVNDLHRHPVAFHAVRLAAAALPVSPMVRHDAPLSVARAFTPAEWRAALAAAGVEGAEVRWWFPFRLCVGWLRCAPTSW